MNWLGVDYGEKRIGLALVSEPFKTGDCAGLPPSPRPLATLVRRGRDEVLARVARAAEQHGATRIVVGVPLAPDGGLGLRGSQARNFAIALGDQVDVPVFLQDERDSSREAMERLVALGVGQKKRGERVDEMAAVIILERHIREGGRGEPVGRPVPPGQPGDRSSGGGVAS